MSVDPVLKQCQFGKEIRFLSKLSVEFYLCATMVNQLVGDLSQQHRRLRSEVVHGIRTDVYEQVFQYPMSKTRKRLVVWFNPKTGLPVKSKTYLDDNVNPEYLLAEYEHIEPDGLPQPDMFSFEAPKGYEIVLTDRQLDDVNLHSVQNEHERGIIRIAFNIDDRAILVCWAYYQREDPSDEPGLNDQKGKHLSVYPRSLERRWDYHYRLLRVDRGHHYHWRWSLIVPKDAPIEGHGTFVFAFDTMRPKELVAGGLLRFEREELADWLAEFQELTLPEDALRDAEITVESLESMIDQYDSQ